MLCLRCSKAPSSAVCGEQTVGDRMRAGDRGSGENLVVMVQEGEDGGWAGARQWLYPALTAR